MISSIVSRLVILVFGTLYPAYASYKAVRTKNVREYVKWMMYWIVFALFSCAETFTDVFLSFWFPFYYEIKILLVLWLLSPATKGSSILYRKFVHPMLSRREQDIDEYIAKAKEQGYHTVLHLGTKGVNYATTVIMQTAIKGGGGLVQQLRRSYSLGDLSSDVDGDSNSGRKALPEAQDRNRDRERVASGGDGRHHRPRGHSPRRSASGSGRVEMYFPEVDVDVRGASVREPSVPLSHIRSSEDVSSGYSSAEPLYQHGGSIGGGQHGESRPDSLASSREPLVRTASVGGSSRSARTRSSRGGGATVTKKGSSSGVPEASEECSLGENDDLDMTSPSYSRSRSNSLPMSADLLRPELVSLLQALNAELEQKVLMSKLSEIKSSEAAEQTEKLEDSFHLAEGEVMETLHRTESSSILELAGTKETSEIKVSESSHPHPSDTYSAVDSDDDFYDSVSVPPQNVLNKFEFKDTKGGLVDSYSETVNEAEKEYICLGQEIIDNRSTATLTSLPSSEMLPNISEQCRTGTENDIDDLLVDSVGISSVGESTDLQNLIPTSEENVKTEIALLQVVVNSHLCSEIFAPAMSEAVEGGHEGDKDDALVMKSTETSKQLEEINAIQREKKERNQRCGDADKTAYNDGKTSETTNVLVMNPTETSKPSDEINNALRREETCLDGILETNHSPVDTAKTVYNDAKASDEINVFCETKDDSYASEQILSSTKGEMNCPNNRASTEEDQEIIGDEFQDASDKKDMKTENSISNDMPNQEQPSLPAASYSHPDNAQHAINSIIQKQFLKGDSSDNKDVKAENTISHDISDDNQPSLPATPYAALDNVQNTTSSADNSSLKADRVEKILDTETVSHKSDSICDSERSLNYDPHIPTNLNSHQDPKKDFRSGKYHKLQAPEPPPRSRRSSSKGSISEETEKKSEHRSHSPKKMVESPVAKLHGQIENLASMLPFWHGGKRSRGKEVGATEDGIRIREMSRSPSRRVGRQAPH